jgi:1-acyl-sn-glycerol-3-phosphate acyltransferase
MTESSVPAACAAKPDGFLRFQYRRLATGFGWAVFGIGGLTLSLTYFPLLHVLVKNKEKRVRLARSAIGASFRLFFRFLRTIGVMRFRLEGLDMLEDLKGAIIVANHPTILDYVFIASALPQVDCMVKASLQQNFFLKGVVRAADYLINDASEALVGECERRLTEGHNILIFPEGTRTVPGRPIKLHRGVAHIALRCGAPIQTIRISCSDRWLDKSSEWYEIPKSRPVIGLRSGDLVNPKEFTKEGEEGFSLAARRLTAHLTQQLAHNEN